MKSEKVEPEGVEPSSRQDKRCAVYMCVCPLIVGNVQAGNMPKTLLSYLILLWC